jgi:peroxiredoxin
MAVTTTDFQAGVVAPDFTLTAPTGEVSLAAYRGRQHVVLYFMRTFDCPVCMGHVTRLARTYNQLQAQNTVVLILGPGEQHEAEQLQHRLKLPFAVIADPDKTVYAQYGLGKGFGGIQRSGSFLVDSDGVVRYANRSTLPTGALKEPTLLAAIMQAQTASSAA